jgi:hypothetical protein
VTERNPKAVSGLKSKHLRTLERRCNFLHAKLSKEDPYRGDDYDKAELAAIQALVAEVCG